MNLNSVLPYIKKQHYTRYNAVFFCDLAGDRTQDPILKRDVLYQLSYQVGHKTLKKSDLAGDRTQDPILKRDVLYRLSYQVILYQSFQRKIRTSTLIFLRVQRYGQFFKFQKKV